MMRKARGRTATVAAAMALAGAVTTAPVAPAAWAGDATVIRGNSAPQPRHTVDRHDTHVVTRRGATYGQPAQRTETKTTLTIPGQRYGAVELVHQPVLAAAATVSRGLAEQPVYPHLAEVQVDQTRVLIDPHRSYRRPTGGIDEDHFIRRAKRVHTQWLSKQRPQSRARVIHGSAKPQAVRPSTQPRAIIEIPKNLRDHPPQHDNAAPPIPSVPAPPKRSDLPDLVQAD